MVHHVARMPVMVCCFALWTFKRVWEGRHLREALDEMYGSNELDTDELVVKLYSMAAQSAAIMWDDECRAGRYVP